MNKKGSAIVEAVMVFPLVILSVTAMIFMMVYFYTQLSERVNMHMTLRAESGEITETLFYFDKPESVFPVYRKVQQIYSSGQVETGGSMILNGRKKEYSARKYLIDEAMFIRMTGVMANEE